jgi:YHS domain-containing protein
MRVRIASVVALILASAALTANPQPAKQKTPREALQVFGDLIGVWNGTGTPMGTREEKQKGFWVEKMDWGWQFKGNDAWIKIDFNKSKNFTVGEIRYLPEKDQFELTLTNTKKEKLTFVGAITMRDTTRILTVDRDDGKESQRLVFTLLHSNRFLYKYDVKADGRPLFATKWSVGATKDGEAFAAGSGKPECVVSGGAGTMAVSFMGKTYYVCCTGCRDEFNATPAKYVAEYEAKLKAKKK